MMRARITSECIEWRPLVLTVIIGFAVIFGSALSVAAQGVCVADLLIVPSITGKVVLKVNDGEEPLTEASIKLKRGNNSGPVIAKQSVKTDGRFSFDHIRPGKYVLIVSQPGLIDFYLDLQVTGSRARKDEKEIVVIMGADFRKPCNGSSAVLRVKKDKPGRTKTSSWKQGR